MPETRDRTNSEQVEYLMDIVGDVVGTETPEGKELLMVIARWEVAEGEAKACAERLREVEGSWHLTYNENLALRQDVEKLRAACEAGLRDLLRFAPAHWRNQTDGEILLRNAIREASRD